jgi:hypothetical protein
MNPNRARLVMRIDQERFHLTCEDQHMSMEKTPCKAFVVFGTRWVHNGNRHGLRSGAGQPVGDCSRGA